MLCIDTMGYQLALNKEISQHGIRWMNLEEIVISKISKSEKHKYYMIPLMCEVPKIVKLMESE